MNIDLRIEQIVLDGVDATSDQSRVIRAAVRAELARLLAERGVGTLTTHAGSIPQITGSTFNTSVAGSPQRLGFEIGRAIHASITGPVPTSGMVRS